MRDLTLQMFRNAYYSSDIFPRLTLVEWQARGRPTADQTLRDHTEHLLHSVQPPADHYELIARGEAFVRQAIS
jgi:trimethylamine:corrinoid methyltransferase-like protein